MLVLDFMDWERWITNLRTHHFYFIKPNKYIDLLKGQRILLAKELPCSLLRSWWPSFIYFLLWWKETVSKKKKKYWSVCKGIGVDDCLPQELHSLKKGARTKKNFTLCTNVWLSLRARAWKCEVLNLECKDIFNSHVHGYEGSRHRWARWEPFRCKWHKMNALIAYVSNYLTCFET